MLEIKTEPKGKAVWLDFTVLGEARELSELGDNASENEVFKTLIEMVYDCKMKESNFNENFLEDIKQLLEKK